MADKQMHGAGGFFWDNAMADKLICGWRVECACGWVSCSSKELGYAAVEFDEHVAEATNRYRCGGHA